MKLLGKISILKGFFSKKVSAVHKSNEKWFVESLSALARLKPSGLLTKSMYVSLDNSLYHRKYAIHLIVNGNIHLLDSPEPDIRSAQQIKCQARLFCPTNILLCRNH